MANQLAADETADRRRPKNRKDLILAAAAQLFRDRGYHAVSIGDIGAAVGITGPAVYRHFDGKEELLLAAADRSLDNILAAVEDVTAGQTGRSALEAGLQAMVTIGNADWDFTVVYVREARSIPRDRRAALDRKRQQLATTLRQLVEEIHPELAGDDLDLRMWALGGVVTGSVLFARGNEQVERPEVLSQLYLRVLETPLEARVGPAQMTGSASSNRASRREALIASAVAQMADQGYHDVYIEQIADAAGITGPGMYRHFASKQEILVAATRRAIEHLNVVTAQAHGSSEDARVRYERLIEGLVDAISSTRGLVVVGLTEGHNLGLDEREEHRREVNGLFDDWTGMLRLVRTELDEPAARLLLEAGVGMAIDVARRRETAQLEFRSVLRELLLIATLNG